MHWKNAAACNQDESTVVSASPARFPPQVRRVLVRPELPRNASSKVLRGALRDELLRTRSKL